MHLSVIDKLPLFETYNIIPICDAHEGDRLFNKEKFKSVVDRIKKEDNTYAVLIGDLINNATKGSKSDCYSETCPPQEQKEFMIDTLSPIKHKIWGSVGGNHEGRTWKESGMDAAKDIAKALDVPYDPDAMAYQINCGMDFKGFKLNYVIYSTHGSGGGGTIGAVANKLYSMSNIMLADLYLMGHFHRKLTYEDEYFMPDTRHQSIRRVKRHYMVCGSYLEYGGYAERSSLKPSGTGFNIAHLNGKSKEIIITK